MDENVVLGTVAEGFEPVREGFAAVAAEEGRRPRRAARRLPDAA